MEIKKGYKDLIVWQKSMDLVVEIYKITEKFPESERYGLVSQMRRSVVSIPSNIAEGSKRSTKKDFKKFLIIALGSGAELETQAEIAKRMKFGINTDFIKAEQLLDECMRILQVLIKRTKD